ncbi:HD domain-containing phosphohydrolase, partial [uncultured Deinococcus sp.]
PTTLEVIRSHHERWDGSGYPDGLRGTAIPLAARIFAVCDVYDALTHVRPYKDAWTHDAAVAEIRAKSGTHFDPAVVEAFLALVTPPTPEARDVATAETHHRPTG